MRTTNVDGYSGNSPASSRLARICGVAALVALLVILAACSATPQANEAKHMANGKRYFAAKDYKRAAIEFRVASQNMPKDAEPLYRLGLTYLKENAPAQALETFQKAVTADPKHGEAKYQVALFEAYSNKPEQLALAKAELQEYSAAHSDDAESLGAMALTEARLGDREDAIQHVDSAIEKDPTQLRPAFIAIAVYTAQGDVETAKVIARGITKRLPNSPEAAVLQAQVSLAARDTADAEAQISRALALKADYQPALLLRLRDELMSNDRQSAEQTTKQLAKLPEKETVTIYGRMLFSEGKVDDGAAEFERVMKESGDSPVVRDDYSRLLMSAGRREQAEGIINGTLAKNPKDILALLQRATLEIDARDTGKAAADIKTLLDMKALSAALSYQQSRLAAALGDTVKQGDLLADAVHRNPGLFSARLVLADLLASSGKGRNAVTILEGASAAEKNTADYIFHCNNALMSAGDWEKARKGVDTGLAMVRSPGFLYQDGMLRIKSHDLAGAQKSLAAAFQAEPTNPLISGLLAETMRKNGDSQKYLAMVRDAIRANPGSAVLQNALAIQLGAMGDRSGERAAYEAARAAGDVPAADVAIAKIDAQAGSLDAAEQRLTGLIKTRDNAPARILLAEVEMHKGSPANAVQNYLKAIEMQPANVEAMNNLAEILATSPNANAGDALFWAQKALALSPTSPVVEDTVGWIYYRQGKYDIATPFLQKSAQSLDRPVAHYHLAGALMKDGDSARARKEYDLAVKQDPKSSARSEVSSLFEGK